MRGHIYFFLLRQPPVRLGGHAPDNRGGFTAGEPSASTCDKEGRGVILRAFQLILEHLRASRCSGTKSRTPPPLTCTRLKPLAGVLVPVQSQRFRHAQAGAEQHGEQRTVT